MKLVTLKQKFSQLLKSNDILKKISLGLLFLVILQQIKILTQHERIILTPPHLTEKATIAYKSASQNYLNSFALFIASQISTTIPATVEYTISAMEPYFDKKVWNFLKPQILAIREDKNYVGINPISNFYPTGGMIYEPETNKIFVLGKLTSVAYRKANLVQLGTIEAVYEMKMYMNKGLPKISEYYAYTGQPKTLAWASKNPKLAQQEENNRQQQILVTPMVSDSEITALDQNGQNSLSLSPINNKTPADKPASASNVHDVQIIKQPGE